MHHAYEVLFAYQLSIVAQHASNSLCFFSHGMIALLLDTERLLLQLFSIATGNK